MCAPFERMNRRLKSLLLELRLVDKRYQEGSMAFVMDRSVC